MASQQKYCCIVDPYVSSDTLCDALLAADILPIAILTPIIQLSETDRQARFAESKFTQVLDFTTVEEIKKNLQELNVLAVIVGNERSCHIADQISAAMDLAFSNSPITSLHRSNKFIMQEVIHQAGLKSIPQVKISAFPLTAEQRIAIEALQTPLVLKPTHQSGSFGVHICQDVAEVEMFLPQLLGKKSRFNAAVNECIVQECLSGDEYIVDSVSLEGDHCIVGVYRYQKEIIQNTPIYRAIEAIDLYSSQGEELAAYLKKVLDALGVKNGMAHSEVFLTASGLVLVEINPRITGAYGMVTLLGKLVYQYSQTDLLVKALLEPKSFHALAKHYFKKPHAGDILCLQSWEDKIFQHFAEEKISLLPSYHSTKCIRKIGEPLKIPTELADTVAFVLLIHEDPAQIKRDSEMISTLEKQNKLFL